MEKILSVEDDNDLGGIIKIMLENKGYQVTTAQTISQALTILENESFDLILLDMMLPDGEGIILCDTIRKSSFCPIIFVTCLSDKEAKIKALEIGGDDYITKPIDFEDLFARIKVNLRRANQYNLGKSFANKEIVSRILLDKDKREVWILDDNKEKLKEIYLSRTEYMLLEYFIKKQDELLLYEELYRAIWNVDDLGDYRTVMVHVSNLRKKLKDYDVDYISTVRSAGYIFRINDNNA